MCAATFKVEEIFNAFNSVDSNLKFTIELPVNNKMSFLDVQLELYNNKIIINLFRKKT